MFILILIYCIAASVAWRFRGGGFYNVGSTQFVRLACGLALALPLALWYENPYFLLMTLTIFIGLAMVGWGDFMDMGNTVGKSEELVSPLLKWMDPKKVSHDILGMSITGVIVMLPTAILFWWLSYSAFTLLVAGALFGPIYYLSWQINKKQPTELAEFIVGFVVGVAICLSLYNTL